MPTSPFRALSPLDAVRRLIGRGPAAGGESRRERLGLGCLAVLGLVLLAGRFDWTARRDLSIQGYVFSGFTYLLLLLGGFSFARIRAWTQRRPFWRISTGATILLNLPLHWLHLDGWYYYRSHPYYYARQPRFISEWIGAGAAWTRTDWFFCTLLLLGTSWLGWRALRVRRRHPSSAASPTRLALAASLFFLICAQTWLHDSDRSPYSYVPHFEQPPAADNAYTFSLLPGNHGLVNADALYFTRLEDIYLGGAGNIPTLMVRRSFPFYLSGGLTYFIGPFYSFVVLNIGIWWAAALAYYALIDAIAGPTTARYAALLLAAGPGFIMYAAQPMAYLAGFAAIALMLYGCHCVFTAPARGSPWAVGALGAALGLSMITMDLFVWLPTVILWGLAMGFPVRRLASACAIGVGVYAAHLWLVFGLFKLPHDDLNDRQMFDALHGAWTLARHPAGARLYLTFAEGLGQYVQQLSLVFFGLPLLFAFLGLLQRGEADSSLRRFAGLCLIPSLATFMVMHLGDIWLGRLPRFNYAAYPAIYALAGGFIGRSEEALSRRCGPAAGRSCAAGLAAACVALANVDAFGFLPHLYYYFYYSFGGHFPG